MAHPVSGILGETLYISSYTSVCSRLLDVECYSLSTACTRKSWEWPAVKAIEHGLERMASDAVHTMTAAV